MTSRDSWLRCHSAIPLADPASVGGLVGVDDHRKRFGGPAVPERYGAYVAWEAGHVALRDAPAVQRRGDRSLRDGSAHPINDHGHRVAGHAEIHLTPLRP